MTLVDAGFAASTIAFLAAIAVCDCRTMRIPPAATALLAAGGLAWHATSPSHFGLVSAAWWMPLAGLAAGFAAPAALIAAAELSRRRWPLMPGDAFLLAGIGAVTGPLGLAWSVAAGAACSALYRAHLQARRNRRFASGYAPLAPGMAAGAALVVAAFASGAVLANGGMDAEAEGERLAAVVLAPEVAQAPRGAAATPVAIRAETPLTLPELAARIAAITGLRIEIEERPSRTGVRSSLPDVPPQAVSWNGPLAGLLDLAAAAHRYRWEWRAGGIVFYRYWDEEFATSTEPGPEVRQARWVIDTSRDATLAEILERWAGEAGWTLVWQAGADYRVGADAVFEGSFLGAVDALLADPITRATLIATAYQANRRLVIGEAP